MKDQMNNAKNAMNLKTNVYHVTQVIFYQVIYPHKQHVINVQLNTVNNVLVHLMIKYVQYVKIIQRNQIMIVY